MCSPISIKFSSCNSAVVSQGATSPPEGAQDNLLWVRKETIRTAIILNFNLKIGRELSFSRIQEYSVDMGSLCAALYQKVWYFLNGMAQWLSVKL